MIPTNLQGQQNTEGHLIDSKQTMIRKCMHQIFKIWISELAMLIVPRNHCPICSHQLPGTVNSSCQVMQVFELIYMGTDLMLLMSCMRLYMYL